MEIDLTAYSDIDVISTTKEKELTLSADSTSIIFQFFSKSIYSNPIGTVVREITSNCFDSHVEAGINDPVLIKKSVDNQTNTIYISFIDYGVGMSPDRIENVFSVYFKSTKRLDNSQIGGFGLGSKSPLAYRRQTGHGVGEYDNSYEIITIFDNIKYSYLIYEGKSGPMIASISQEATTDHNGTEVRIPVLEKDVSTFEKEMVRQLYYFENIVFDGFDFDVLTNDYQIIRGKRFLYRGNTYSNNIHLCLGRVAYPINYDVLNLNQYDYNIPIALIANVGEIGVTASRETLDYNENTIKIIKSKLELAKAEIVQLLNKQYSNIVTLKDYFNLKNNFGTLVFANGMSIKTDKLVNKKEIDFSNFKYSGMMSPTDKQLFRLFFNTTTLGKKLKSRYGNGFDGGYDELKSKQGLYYVDGEFKRNVKKHSYLKDLNSTYYIINKRNLTLAYMRSEISDIFNVHVDKLVDENGVPTEYVQSLIDMQDEFFDIVRENASNYDLVDVPAEYLIRKKRNVLNDEVRNTTFPIKIFGSWSKTRVKVDDLVKLNHPIFYGTIEDERKLDNAYSIFRILFDGECLITGYSTYYHNFERNHEKKGLMFAMVSTSTAKYLKFCKEAVHINEFYKRMLKRKAKYVMDYFQSNLLIEKFNDLQSMYRDNNFTNIDPNWGGVIKSINVYIDKQKFTVDISVIKSELSQYFDFNSLTLTSTQKKYSDLVDSLMELQEKNRSILRHINTPSRLEYYDNDLYDILKKVMVL